LGCGNTTNNPQQNMQPSYLHPVQLKALLAIDLLLAAGAVYCKRFSVYVNRASLAMLPHAQAIKKLSIRPELIKGMDSLDH
jgi:hypothetical protein